MSVRPNRSVYSDPYGLSTLWLSVSSVDVISSVDTFLQQTCFNLRSFRMVVTASLFFQCCVCVYRFASAVCRHVLSIALACVYLTLSLVFGFMKFNSYRLVIVFKLRGLSITCLIHSCVSVYASCLCCLTQSRFVSHCLSS